MAEPTKPMRGYIVLVRGLESRSEWEAAYTLVFTNKRKALGELASCRASTDHEYRLGVVEWATGANRG